MAKLIEFSLFYALILTSNVKFSIIFKIYNTENQLFIF
jgi:hypothetical protein